MIVRWGLRWLRHHRSILFLIAGICLLAWLVGDRHRWWLPTTAAILFTAISIEIVVTKGWKTK